MEKIIEFINTHPMVSWSGIEKELSLPKGTLRSGHNMNTKYIVPVEQIITKYGYSQQYREDTQIETPQRTGKSHKVMRGILFENKSGLMIRSNLPDGTILFE
jgi:hypothetical protein